MMDGKRAAKPLEFLLLDQGVDEDDFLHLVPTIHAARRGDRLITDADQFVKVVAQQCDRMQARIGVLHILTTGNGQGFWLGKSWISIATLPQQGKRLAGLRDYFASPVADVVVLCDESGLDGLVLARLARLWGLERVRPHLDRPRARNYAGPRGLDPHSFKLKVAAVRFEHEEGAGNYLFS